MKYAKPYQTIEENAEEEFKKLEELEVARIQDFWMKLG